MITFKNLDTYIADFKSWDIDTLMETIYRDLMPATNRTGMDHIKDHINEAIIHLHYNAACSPFDHDTWAFIRSYFNWDWANLLLHHSVLVKSYISYHEPLWQYCDFSTNETISLITQYPNLSKLYSGQDPSVLILGVLVA